MRVVSIKRVIVASVFLLAAVSPKDPFLGSWKLNFQKSLLPGKDVQSQRLVVEMVVEGQRNVIESVAVSGDVINIQYITNVDGKDAVVFGIRGQPTVAVKMIGPRSREAVWKNNGKIFQKTTSTISDDNKTMKIEAQTFNREGKPYGEPKLYVYERE